MFVGPGPEWDTQRWQRAIPTSITTTQRVEVWAEGQMLAESAPVIGGAVTNDWVTAGISRSLSITVPPTRSWLRWLALPSLELRPWQGIRFSGRLTMECPMGVFPVQPPGASLPAEAISIQAHDYMEWVSDADFPSKPVPRPAGRLVAAIGWLLRGAGLPAPENRSTATGSAPSVQLEDTRLDALEDAAKAAGVEVTCDRYGDPQIINAQRLGAPVSELLTGDGGTCIAVTATPDWSAVHNVVSVTSSAPDVSFPAQIASVTWTGHPAHPYRLGSPQRPRYRVLHYSSPLLTTPEQAQQAAQTILSREAAVAQACTISAIPDPTRDAGDTIRASTPDGVQLVQISQVVHPLGGEPSQITAATMVTQ